MQREEYIYKMFHRNSYNYHSQMKFVAGEPHETNLKLNYLDNLKVTDEQVSNNNDNYSQTSRNFMVNSKDIKDVLNTLHNTYVLKEQKNGDYKAQNPSAGGIHPTEIYIISLKLSGLSPGVYHYNKIDGNLYFCNSNSDISKFMVENNKFTSNASYLIVMTSNVENGIKKYGARYYRYALIEVGHIGQIICEYLNYKNERYCPIGGFYDRNLNKFLNLPEPYVSLYMIAVD